MTAADRYHSLKLQEAQLKKELAKASEEVNALLDDGKEVITTDGTRYVRRIQERNEYKVSGVGGVLALLRNHPELDPATLLSVTAAGVKKLNADLQAKLSFTVNEVKQVVKG